jgi:hypothetical protein
VPAAAGERADGGRGRDDVPVLHSVEHVMRGLQGGAAVQDLPLDAPDMRSLACDFWPDCSGQQSN